MLSVETLADLKRSNASLFGHCRNPDCARGRPLDLDMLIERFGSDYVLTNETRIAASLRCDACGTKGGIIHHAPDTTPRAPNPYLKAKGG